MCHCKSLRRSPECTCGQSHSAVFTKPQVTPPSRCGTSHFRDVEVSSVGLVCHSRERALPVILQSPVSDARCVGGCISVRLGLPASLRVSPIPLIPRVLRKIRQDLTQVIFVALDRQRKVWCTDLLYLSLCPQLHLPFRADLLSQSQGQVLHPNLLAFDLHAWRLNGATRFFFSSS